MFPAWTPIPRWACRCRCLFRAFSNTLVTIDENLEVVPDLASSWEVKDGGKTYIFTSIKASSSTMAPIAMPTR